MSAPEYGRIHTDGSRSGGQPVTPHYLLTKRGLYYSPNRQGYTGVKERAGRYFAEDAMPDIDVLAVHEDEAPDYSPACWHEVKVEHLMAQISALRDKLALADELLMEAWGAFPLPYNPRREDALIIRAVTGQDLHARKRAAERAREAGR